MNITFYLFLDSKYIYILWVRRFIVDSKNEISKILTVGLVLPYLKSRGTEKQALRLAKGFIKKGTRVVVFIIQGWGSKEMYHEFTCAGAEVVNVGEKEFEGEKKVQFSRFFSLSKMSRKYDCDILLSRAGMANRISGYAGLIAKIPTISVISGAIICQNYDLSDNILKNFVLSFFFKKSLGFPTHIITVSKEGRNNILHNYPNYICSVTAIPNGVDFKHIVEMSLKQCRYVLPNDKFNISYAGSIEIGRKGLDVLIEALKIIIYEANDMDVQLTIIGTGDDMDEVKAMVDQYSLHNNVIFTGESDNPYNIIKQSDLFILPSRREGLPNALLEAMSLGICCIAADCDTGPREIIENYKNGILFPVGDSNALAYAILDLKSNCKMIETLGSAGKKTVHDKFLDDLMVEKYYNLIQNIVIKK